MTGPTPWEYHRVYAAIGANPDDVSPTWTDITPWVDGVSAPTQIQTGRPTEQVVSEAGTWSLVLNNTDHRFTFGNASSPYAPFWRQGLKIRIVETIGYRSYPLFTGWLEENNIDDWAPPGVDQQITVTLSDRLTRADRARTFIGTLAEYILYNGGSGLVAYYPCNETAVPFADATGTGHPPLRQIGVTGGTNAVISQYAALLPGQGAPVYLDDTPTAVIQAGIGVNSGNNTLAQVPDVRVSFGNSSTGPPIGVGQVLTAVIWVNGNPPPTPYDLTTFGFTVTTLNANLLTSLDSRSMLSLLVNGAFSVSGTATVLPITGWTPLAIRYGYSPAVFEVWVGSTRYTFTGSGSAASDVLIEIALPEIQCAFGHLQLYIGNATDWDLPQLIAQSAAARTCLTGQYSGQRIRTMAAYAGISTSELSRVDTGVALMGRAHLAGSTPYAQMANAETTEQGRLYADGNGLINFDARTRRYNR